MKVHSLFKQKENIKYVLELDDGAYVEASLFIHQKVLHYCVPSQVGCPLGCIHCSTSFSEVPYIRQMKVNEIIQMIEIMKNDAKGILLPWVLSFSGHGEPMLNWDVVIEVINYFNGQFSENYITSVGIVPVLEDILKGNTFPNIYFSIHGSNDVERRKIIHQENKSQIANIKQIIKFGKQYSERGGKVIWNYMVCSLNSSPSSIQRLVALAETIDYPIEIRFTQYIKIGVQNGIKASSYKMFSDMVTTIGRVNNPLFQVRKSFLEGTKIGIACGQLRAHAQESLGKE